MKALIITLAVVFLALIILTIIIVIIGSRKKTTSTGMVNNQPNTTQPNTTTKKSTSDWFFKNIWRLIGIIIVAMLVIFLAILLWNAGSNFIRWCNTPTVQKTYTVQKNSGKQKTLYRFSDFDKGIISLNLTSHADWYPKGGKIKIKTSSGEIWDDEPGKQYDRSRQPPGTFSFWANPEHPGAWGIEIWE